MLLLQYRLLYTKGTLNYLGLANNTFSGIIPSELGDLRGASVFVRGDSFHINATTPLSLCTLVRVKYSDLANDTNFCPIERTALSNISVSAKGEEWTDRTNWMDEYASHCDWYGVKCDKDNQVIELNLRNNGLSGSLSSSIRHLTSMTKLDLSDNDIKVMPFHFVLFVRCNSITLIPSFMITIDNSYLPFCTGIDTDRGWPAHKTQVSAS